MGWSASDSIADGEAEVTLRNSLPCFSFPRDDATRAERFLLYQVTVSSHQGLTADSGVETWKLRVDQENRRYLSAANSPDQCIEYGAAGPSKRHPAVLSFEANVPYQVFMIIYSPDNRSSSSSVRTYYETFCVASDASGNKRIVKADYQAATGRYACRD